jgi:hypothetical protein
MRREHTGIAGFLAWKTLNESAVATGEQAVMGWAPVPGLLSGAAGIGLALLAAATPIEPAWDRILLISIPPGAENR